MAGIAPMCAVVPSICERALAAASAPTRLSALALEKFVVGAESYSAC